MSGPCSGLQGTRSMKTWLRPFLGSFTFLSALVFGELIRFLQKRDSYKNAWLRPFTRSLLLSFRKHRRLRSWSTKRPQETQIFPAKGARQTRALSKVSYSLIVCLTVKVAGGYERSSRSFPETFLCNLPDFFDIKHLLL